MAACFNWTFGKVAVADAADEEGLCTHFGSNTLLVVAIEFGAKSIGDLKK